MKLIFFVTACTLSRALGECLIQTAQTSAESAFPSLNMGGVISCSS